MKLKTAYIFKGEAYNNYADLATAMAKNWNDALNELKNGVSLNYFKRNDPYIYGQMDVELKRCKYLDNVLTLFLHCIAPELGVCIKGKFFKSIVDIAKYMDEQYSSVVPGIKAFFEDKCVSHLFMDEIICIEGGITEFTNLVPSIEAQINESFSYYYFFKHITMNEFSRNNIDYYLTHILTQNDTIQTLYNVTRRDDFLYALANIIGFDKTIAYKNNPDFLFGLYDIVNKHTNFNFENIAYSGYHIFMLANFKNYTYNSKNAKNVYGQYIKMAAKYTKGKEVDLTFARQTYELYLRLVALYTIGEVTTNNLRYAIDKKCCNTLCCLAYDNELKDIPALITPKVSAKPQVVEEGQIDNSNIVTDDMFNVGEPDFMNAEEEKVVPQVPVQPQVTTANIAQQNINPNPTGAPIYIVVNGANQPSVQQDFSQIPQEPDFSNEALANQNSVEPVQSEEEVKKISDAAKKMRKFKTTYGRKARFALFSLLVGAWLVVEFVLSVTMRSTYIINQYFDYGVVGCGALIILTAFILLLRNSKSKRLSKAYFNEDGTPMGPYDELTKLDRSKVRKSIYYSFSFSSSFIMMLASYGILCCVWFYVSSLLPNLNIEFINGIVTSWNNYYILIAPVLSILLCIIKKKKTTTYAIICWILEIILIFGAVGVASLF